MNVIIRDNGFAPDDWDKGFEAWTGENTAGQAIDIENTVDPKDLKPFFETTPLIRIGFPSSADGRGFTLARALRLAGYKGRLRAFGHILADQYAMARRVGFDEVEISDELAARQTEEQWLFRANWQHSDYQARLKNRIEG